MEYIELSINDTKNKCIKLYNNIIKEYDYDLVIFIAKGSYLIGSELAKLNNVTMLEIFATRKGNKMKQILRPIFKIIPKKVLIFIRKKEMSNNYHEKNNDRNIKYDEVKYSNFKNKKRILLVDDSIDSGNSMILAKKTIQDYFSDAEIKVAVFNVMSKSSIVPDYYLYKNTMICGPWSNDSSDNKEHIEKYNAWIRGEE